MKYKYSWLSQLPQRKRVGKNDFVPFSFTFPFNVEKFWNIYVGAKGIYFSPPKTFIVHALFFSPFFLRMRFLHLLSQEEEKEGRKKMLITRSWRKTGGPISPLNFNGIPLSCGLLIFSLLFALVVPHQRHEVFFSSSFLQTMRPPQQEEKKKNGARSMNQLLLDLL